MANIKRANTSGITKSGVAIPDVPDAPTIGAATNVGTSRAYNNGSATVAFTAAAKGGTSTSFTATSTPGGLTASGAGSPLTVTGLQSATSYTFAVTGTNASATGAASAASSSITATTVPAAPTIGTPTVASGQSYTGSANVSVPFTAGATGGAAVSTFTVTSSSGGTATGASSPITVSDTVGTARTYTVTATNANGTSTASSASASTTPVSVPQAPTIGTVTLSGTTASVPFTAGATGGSAVSTFTATSSPGGLTGTGSTPISVTGLTAGTAYTFTVTATNAQGTSAASSASNSVTPVSYFTMAWADYYPYNIAARTSGFAISGYSSGPGTGNALVNDSGAVITNGNKYPNTTNGSGTQRNAYGVDASGNTYWTSSGTNKLYVISQDSSGAVRWQSEFTNPTGSSNAIYWSGAHLGRDGNFYIWGTWIVAGPSSVPFLSKINGSTGNIVWSKRFTENNGPYSCAVDSSGNVCIRYSSGFIVGYNSSGTQTFKKAINSMNDYANRGSVADSAGNFYMVGAESGGTNGILIFKINSSGVGVWARKITTSLTGGKGADWRSGMATLTTDSSDNVYMVHYGNDSNMGGSVVKLDSSGNTSWKRRLFGENVFGYSISVDSTNQLMYMCGQTIGNGGNRGWAFKLPTDGTKTGTYAFVGNNITYADASSLSVSSYSFSTADSTYITIGTNGPNQATSSLTFTTTSDFNGRTPTVTSI
jgi:hypothetical protein